MPAKSQTTQSSRGQQTISSFFAKSPSKKRKSSPIDLTANDSDEALPPPTKKAKNVATTTSSFFLRDTASPEASEPGPSRLASSSQAGGKRGKGKTKSSVPSASQSADRWRYTPLSDEAVFKSSATGKSKGNAKANNPAHDNSIQQPAASSFREKLRRRDSTRKCENITSGSLGPPCEDPHPTEAEEVEEADRSGLTKIKKFAAKSPPPWEKGAASKKSSRKALQIIGPAGLPCTPLEDVVIRFKKKYPDTVLLIEVGYKYCFFGDDAKVAGQVLGFFYGLDHNFLRTSFPVHNLKVNMKKLVAAGYKVGVISQVETAALKKAGDNRNTLFDRELTQLCTPSTFVDDLDSQEDFDNFDKATPPLMCIVEEARKSSAPDDIVHFGLISVVPSTGDIVYDDFEDTLLRSELETRLTHIRPCELLLPSKLSAPTEKALRHFAEHGFSSRVRIERTKHKLNYSDAFDYISEVYQDRLIASIADLPKHVVIALALALKHLAAFGLSETLLQTRFFSKFTTRAHMLLNTSTIKNLEIYCNQTDFTEKGTLFSVLNHTTTMFGKRLLKSWVGRPLVDNTILQQRMDAVEEARAGESSNLIILRGLLKGLPDLARGLCSIQYGRCTPKELATLLTAFNRIGATFPPFDNPSETGCSSTMWKDIIFALPALRAPLKELLSFINLHRAREDDKMKLWTDPEKFPALESAEFAIMAVESDLAEQLKHIRKLLRTPALKYVSSNRDEFLIEVPKERASAIPPAWVRVSSTSKVMRFHTPEIIKLLQERELHQETLQAEANKAYKEYLKDMGQHYALFRDVVNKLATADCLMSLAIIALHGEFCKPVFVEKKSLSITGGRHPIIEQLRSDPYVPTPYIRLGGDCPRNLVISGPNMGGKTSVVKMIALIVIMAQIGSYVPAESVVMSIHDTILTRMGASDDLAAGRSTFMLELTETSDIIKSATPNSLVILDELGRGTSTFDGMAIAGAVLEHLACVVKCEALFITHYPTIARELEARYPSDIANMHMGFMEYTCINGQREIRFLYTLMPGISAGSFGIECARLAGVPEVILEQASSQAAKMQELMDKRNKKTNAKDALQLLQQCVTGRVDAVTLRELETRMKIMGL